MCGGRPDRKRERYIEEQVISILKEYEAGASVPDISRRQGVAENTVYRWKSKFGGMEVSDAKRPNALERENAELRTMVAEQALHIRMLKDVNSRIPVPERHRQAVRHLQRELASIFGRHGYRRNNAPVRRQGWHVNHKRVARIWRRE